MLQVYLLNSREPFNLDFTSLVWRGGHKLIRRLNWYSSINNESRTMNRQHEFTEHLLSESMQNMEPRADAASVYVIDDMSTAREILKVMVQSIDPGLTVRVFENPEYVFDVLEDEIPDLVLTDYQMPQMNGEEFIRKFRTVEGCEEVPILVVTVDPTKNVLSDCMDAGANDFLMRPFDQIEARSRCQNLLRLRNQHLALSNRSERLQYEVEQVTSKLYAREKETIIRLSRASEYRDDESADHVIRMAKYSRAIAEELQLSRSECAAIEMSAPMHDIGKIGISDTLLNKTTKFTDDEKIAMQEHTKIGFQILQGSQSEYVQLGAKIALYHHEAWDGSGYPFGVAGEDIPLAARIVAVADVYDALRTDRPYRERWSNEAALNYLKAESGKQFDPKCVAAFMRCIEQIHGIEQEFEGLR